MICQRISKCIERRMPDFTDEPMRIVKAEYDDAWNIPSIDSCPMAVKYRKGAIMGRVNASCWRIGGRIYYQLRGPESPEDNTNGKDINKFVFCEAEYHDGQSHKVEQYSRGGATKLWRYRGQVIARSAVTASRYRIERENKYITIAFWTPDNEQPQTVRFFYREDGQEGRMDFQPHHWPTQELESTGGMR